MVNLARTFFVTAFLYVAFAIVVTFIFREQPLAFIDEQLDRPVGLIRTVLSTKWLMATLIVLIALAWRRINIDFAKTVFLLFIGGLALSYSFSIVKTTMPLAVPFFADEFFMNLDKAVHFGIDPWRIVHKFADKINNRAVDYIYFFFWIYPAFLFTLILALTDRNVERVSRFLLIYIFIFFVLGNIVAMAGLSVGPVYFDRYLETDYFTELHESFRESGFDGRLLYYIQEELWKYLPEDQQRLGSGISAFPSVHVAMAAMFALYGGERHWVLGVVLWVYCLAILFLSVYSGWHYAVDGYFSIAAVLAFWATKIGLPYAKTKSVG